MAFPQTPNFAAATQNAAWWLYGPNDRRSLFSGDGYTITAEIQRKALEAAQRIEGPITVPAGRRRGTVINLPGRTATANGTSFTVDGAIGSGTLAVLHALARTQGVASAMASIEDDLERQSIGRETLRWALEIVSGGRANGPATLPESFVPPAWGVRPARPRQGARAIERRLLRADQVPSMQPPASAEDGTLVVQVPVTTPAPTPAPAPTTPTGPIARPSVVTQRWLWIGAGALVLGGGAAWLAWRSTKE